MRSVSIFSLLRFALAFVGAVAVAQAKLPVTGQNFAIGLTIDSLKTATRYGARQAPDGRQFVILATRWENRIDPKFATERGVATAYTVPDLSQHLFLAIDGVSVATLLPATDDGTGRKSLGSITLSKPGAKTLGDVVFEAPAGPFTSADLRFLDDTTGYIALALAEPTPAPKPQLPLQKNQVVEMGIWSFTDEPKSPAPPAGFRRITVDLRARSLWTMEGEAPAYDPNATGSVTRVHLLDWSEARNYIHVLADGEYAYPVEESSAFLASPRFIPEFFSGGQLTFFVPADATSLDLLCEMPHASAPGSGTLDLAPMAFPLRALGAPAKAADKSPLLTIKDEMFSIAVLSARKTDAFHGESAGEDKQLIVLDVRVKNEGASGEFFVPRDQLSMLNADESEVGVDDDATAKGPHRPESQVHFPPGASRRFEVVFRIDKSVTRPRLSFRGGSFQQAYELKLSP